MPLYKNVISDFFCQARMLIKNYIQRTKSYTVARFIIELTLLAIIGKIITAYFISGVIYLFQINNLANQLPKSLFTGFSNPVFKFIFFCIIGPIFETIILQWLPIKLLQRISSKLWIVLGVDAAIFSLVHWNLGVYMLVMLTVGLVFAWSFISNAKISTFKALWVTSCIHGLFNLIALLAIVFL